MKKNTSNYIYPLLFVFTILFACKDTMSAATPFSNERLKYVISYKWGLIHKDAGDATLSLNRKGGEYNVMLAAKSKPWADKIYQVRDTLKGTIRVKDLKPLTYTKITHGKGKYARDEIKYTHNGNSTSARAVKHRVKNSQNVTTEKSLSAEGPVYDMLSVFYYLRKLDYAQLNKNKIYTATIFSGSKKETIKIHSLGIKKIKLKDNTTHEAYHVKFNFTSKGGKKSSDDIDTWISTDEKHIPLYLTAKLPIGEVRAYLMR